LLDLHRNYRITGISLVRYASTNETVANKAAVIDTATNETPPQSSPYDEIPGL